MPDGTLGGTTTTSYFDSFVERFRAIDIARFEGCNAHEHAAHPARAEQMRTMGTIVGPASDDMKRNWLMRLAVRGALRPLAERMEVLQEEARTRDGEIPDDDPMQIEYRSLVNQYEDLKAEDRLLGHFMNREVEAVYPDQIPQGSVVYFHPETHALGYVPAEQFAPHGVVLIL